MAGLLALAPAARASDRGPEEPPPFALLRYDEDYSYLRDPAARAGDPLALEPIKYVPLNSAGDWYWSMGGEVRQRYEYFHNRGFGTRPLVHDDYLLQRYVLHGDLHIGPRLRFFGQLRGAFVAFDEGPNVPVNGDGFDVQQGFFDARWEAQWDGALTLRVGRQEMSYGTERLISVREASSVRRAFNAVRVLGSFQAWRADGFVSQLVENVPGYFDPWFQGQAHFWGIYVTGPVWQRGGLNMDAYYLGLDRLEASFNQGSGHELRHTVGARLFSGPSALDYNFEGMYQWGDFGGAPIRAWALASDTGVTVQALPLMPRIGLRANVTSGSRARDGDVLGTFNPLFPRGNYFGQSAVVGPMNLLDVHPMLSLQVSEAVALEAGWANFWRYSLEDGLYNNGLVLVQAAGESASRHIGSELSFAVDWEIGRHVKTNVSYSHFFTGPFLKDTGPGHDMNFLMVLAKYQF